MRKRRPFNPKRRTIANIARAHEKKAATMKAVSENEEAFLGMFQNLRIGPKRPRAPKPSPDNNNAKEKAVRTSNRKTMQQLMREKLEEVRERVAYGTNEDLVAVFKDPIKGRGLQALASFKRNEYVIEYRGTMMTYERAKRVEEQYSHDESIGCYMFFFSYNSEKWCVDATEETIYKGRLVSHSRRSPNLKAVAIDVYGEHRLILYANKDIKIGDELLYDYGDRSSATIAQNPWLLD